MTHDDGCNETAASATSHGEISSPGETPVERLVASAVVHVSPALLDQARVRARTTRERQLVVLGAAWLRGDRAQFDALVRDHLVEFPDSVLAAWMAGRSP